MEVLNQNELNRMLAGMCGDFEAVDKFLRNQGLDTTKEKIRFLSELFDFNEGVDKEVVDEFLRNQGLGTTKEKIRFLSELFDFNEYVESVDKEAIDEILRNQGLDTTEEKIRFLYFNEGADEEAVDEFLRNQVLNITKEKIRFLLALFDFNEDVEGADEETLERIYKEMVDSVIIQVKERPSPEMTYEDVVDYISYLCKSLKNIEEYFEYLKKFLQEEGLQTEEIKEFLSDAFGFSFDKIENPVTPEEVVYKRMVDYIIQN